MEEIANRSVPLRTPALWLVLCLSVVCVSSAEDKSREDSASVGETTAPKAVTESETIVVDQPQAAFQIAAEDRGAQTNIQYCDELCDFGVCAADCATVHGFRVCVGQAGIVCCPHPSGCIDP